MTKDVRHGLGVLALAAVFALLWLGLGAGGSDFEDVAQLTRSAAILFGIGAAILLAVALLKGDRSDR